MIVAAPLEPGTATKLNAELSAATEVMNAAPPVAKVIPTAGSNLIPAGAVTRTVTLRSGAAFEKGEPTEVGPTVTGVGRGGPVLGGCVGNGGGAGVAAPPAVGRPPPRVTVATLAAGYPPALRPSVALPGSAKLG